jgi:hypothetical protein
MLTVLLAAAIAFDSNMSEEEMRETGISKLTIQERAALQEWIEDHHSKKMVTQNKKTGPIIQEVLKGGRYVRLSDNSLWEIDTPDRPITQSWITPTEIKVATSNNPDFPNTLTNTLTGSTVKARKAQSVSPEPAPAPQKHS